MPLILTNYSLYIFIYLFPGGLLPRLGLGLGLGKLRYRTGGPGGLPPGLGLGLGKLRDRTGGPGGLPPGLGFGLGKFRDPTEVPEACVRG